MLENAVDFQDKVSIFCDHFSFLQDEIIFSVATVYEPETET